MGARRDFAPTIQLLASRWADAGLLLPAFPLLARGRPVEIDEIAAASGVTAERVTAALDTARCARDSAGRLIDLYGLTLTPTSHRLEIGGRILYSCCALWAHVIPKLVEATVRIESVDPLERQLVRLSITPDGVSSLEPAGSAASLAIADQEAITADVCEAFCCHVHHFVSRESAEAFAGRTPRRLAVGVEEMQQAADLLFSSIRGSGC